MNKTLRNTHTEYYPHTLAASLHGAGDVLFSAIPGNDDMPVEMNMLREAANDLLQPRPEAVARLLELAKHI